MARLPVYLNECLPSAARPSCSVPSQSQAMRQRQACAQGVRQLRAGSEPRQLSRVSTWRCGWWGRWSPIKGEEEGTSRRDGSAGNSGSLGGGLTSEEGTCARDRVRVEIGRLGRQRETARMKCVCVCVCVCHIHTFPNSMCMCLCVSLSHLHTLPNYPWKRPEAAALLVPTYWFISVIKGWLQGQS